MGAKLSGKDKYHDQTADTQFIIEFHKKQTINGVNRDLESILSRPNKRLVWVSLSGLCTSYQQCPMSLLIPSIFVLPIKTTDIYNAKQMSASLLAQCAISLDEKAMSSFLHLLRFKDSQNLLFCMLDHEQSQDNECSEKNQKHADAVCQPRDHIASFWRHLSTSLIALKLNGFECVYCKPAKFESRYQVEYSAVQTELVCLQMRYKSMQELIYQSNPDTLEPIVVYTADMWKSKEANAVFVPCKLDDHPNSVWFISSDYEQ